MFNVIITEFLKLKHSKILWLIPIGAIVPVLMALLSLSQMYNSNDPSAHYWGMLLKTVLVFSNYFSSAILALITGFIFTREYQEITINVLFTYPISRLKFYISKLIVSLFLTTVLFTLSIIFTLISGIVFKYEMFISEFLVIFIKYSLFSILLNFLLVPIAAFVGIKSKTVLSTSALGIVYVMSMLFLNKPEYSVYIPCCIPSLIASLKGYVMGGFLSFTGDLNKAYITLMISFTASVLIGLVYYKNTDVT